MHENRRAAGIPLVIDRELAVTRRDLVLTDGDTRTTRWARSQSSGVPAVPPRGRRSAAAWGRACQFVPSAPAFGHASGTRTRFRPARAFPCRGAAGRQVRRCARSCAVVGCAERWIRGHAGWGCRVRGVGVEEAVLSHCVVSRCGGRRASRGGAGGGEHREPQREPVRRRCDARCQPARRRWLPARLLAVPWRAPFAPPSAGGCARARQRHLPQHPVCRLRRPAAACELQRHVQPRQRGDQLQPGIRATRSGPVRRKRLRRWTWSTPRTRSTSRTARWSVDRSTSTGHSTRA